MQTENKENGIEDEEVFVMNSSTPFYRMQINNVR